MTKEERDAAYRKALDAARDEMEELLREDGRLQGELNALRFRRAHLERAMTHTEKCSSEITEP